MTVLTGTGGVTAPKGFRAAGLHCGVKDNFTNPQPEKKDLAMVLSDVPCTAAGTYTRNVVKADPVLLTMEHLKDGKAQGVILDSGNANACAPKGMENAKRMAEAAASATGLKPEDFAVCSTGIIGVELNISAIESHVPALVKALTNGVDGSDAAARAIMTTDTRKKEIAVSAAVGGKTVTVGGIAGCTALMLCGFGLRDAITDIGTEQGDGIYRFDATVYVNGADEDTEALFSGNGITAFYPTRQLAGTVDGIGTTLFIAKDPASLPEINRLPDFGGGPDLVPAPGTVIVTEKLASMTGLSVGDTVAFTDADSRQHREDIAVIKCIHTAFQFFIERTRYFLAG